MMHGALFLKNNGQKYGTLLFDHIASKIVMPSASEKFLMLHQKGRFRNPKKAVSLIVPKAIYSHTIKIGVNMK